MTTLITTKFREHLGEQFVESINEPANNVYYVVASKHTPYTGGDETIPTPLNNTSELEINIFEEGIFGKKVNASDVSLMIPRYNWTSNTIYDHYDQDDGNLTNKKYYVAVDGGTTYYIYKCLDNNRGVPSTEQPSSTSESACNFITTSDGYTWKLMYKMADSTFEKFATNDLMPVVDSANVSGSTVAGAIDVIRITNTGSGYISTLTGQFQIDDLREAIPSFSGNSTTYRLTTSASSNSDFYVGSALYITGGTGSGQVRKIVDYTASNRVAVVNTSFAVAPSSDSTYLITPLVEISGDGSNASAYAVVSSNATVNNFISKINVVSRGSNYTYATATVTGNTGGVSNNATLKVIIPPVGGHGYDATSELGSKSVGVSLSFNTSESGYITTFNDYRKFVLLKDPLFKNVHLTLTDEVGTFTTNETIYQYNGKGLRGTATGNTITTELEGVSTEYDTTLAAGDKIVITDNITNISCLRTVESITNATSLTLNSALPFITSSAKVTYITVTATGKKSGNTSPYLTLTNAEPKFQTNKTIIGVSSGAVASISSINVNEKNFNSWNTFDNRTRLSYSAASGTITPDAPVFQTDVSLSNAFFHSANSTYVFLTSERGTINPEPSQQLRMVTGSNTVTLGSIKYTPDIVKGSGKVLYIENNSPITRSNSQSETIRLIINF